MDDILEFQGLYRYLSNFWLVKVKLDGLEYPSVEHAFQAAKTLDNQQREEIRTVQSPAEAKKLGRKVTLRNGWEDMKIKVMTDLVRQKFNIEPWGSMLVATGDRKLVHGNYWEDYEFGVCKGRGKNHLGKILTKIRKTLAKKFTNEDISNY